MTEQLLPPLPAIGNAIIEIFGPAAGVSRWGQALWDQSDWGDLDWRDLTPQSMVMKLSWGADDPAGILTVPAAGGWSIETYDPDRKLDPSNANSPYGASLRPGRPMRLGVVNAGVREVIRVGVIDEVQYDLKEKRGTLRGTDIVPLIVQAKLAKTVFADVGLPTTLRARARWLLGKAGLDILVPVEPDPQEGEPPVPFDPVVGPLPVDRDASTWAAMGTSAYDALHMMWIDRLGTLRFRSFGSPVDNGLQVGGDGGIPIATVKPSATIQNVYTTIRAFDDGAPTVPVVKTNDVAVQLYGIIPLTREKPVPDADFWATNVLADRSGSSLQYETGTLYPRTFDELMSLITADLIDSVHIVVDDVVPPLDLSARLLGVRLTADTDTGWTGEVLTYIPANEWVDEAPLPPDPPTEPPPATHVETRTYAATKDTRAAQTSGGSNYGSGTEGELPVGSWQGWRNRAFIDFADIPWSKVVSVDKCILNLDTTTQVNLGFGSAPKVIVARVTASWSEGSLSSPGSGNSTVYPGPSCTTSGQVTKTVTGSENAAVSIDITAIARAWFGGSAQHGVRIISAGEDSDKYSTEFWSRENSTSGKRPSLSLTVTVQD